MPPKSPSSKEKSHPALDLLTRAQPASRAPALFTEKILTRPLYLKPTASDESTSNTPKDGRDKRQRARAQKDAEKKRKRAGRPKPLSAKQKRALRVYEVPRGARFEMFVPLWRLWCAYVREILGLVTQEPPQQQQLQQAGMSGKGESNIVGGAQRRWYVDAKTAGPILASADFHGARVEVVRSGCVSRVGIRGIVVRDTKFTFEIVRETGGGGIRVVPKEGTVFRFEVPPPEDEDGEGKEGEWKDGDGPMEEGKEKLKPLVFELHGYAFQHRAPDRATKKFVLHLPKDL